MIQFPHEKGEAGFCRVAWTGFLSSSRTMSSLIIFCLGLSLPGLTSRWVCSLVGLTGSWYRRNGTNTLPRLFNLPIKLNSKVVDCGPRPLWLENRWLLHKDFLTLVGGWWAQLDCQVFAGFRIVKKLQVLVLKSKIKEWNKDVFGRLEVDRDSALRILMSGTWERKRAGWISLKERPKVLQSENSGSLIKC